jgi:hypothetical protein
MSIAAEYIRITAEDFERLPGNAALIKVFFGHVGQQSDEHYQLLRGQGRTLVIGSRWQAFHYFLTGEICQPGKSQLASPLAKVIMGGEPVPFEDYSETERALTPNEVKEIARALQPLTAEQVLADFQKHRHISLPVYRAGLPSEWSEGELDSLSIYYSGLRDFYLKAASEGDAVLIWIG